MSGWTPRPLDQTGLGAGWIPRGSQPRHGHPRGYEQQAAARSRADVPAAGHDAPARRRGAHALPDDDVDPRSGGAAHGGSTSHGYDAGATYAARQAYAATGHPPTGTGPHHGGTHRGQDNWDRQDGYMSRPSRPVGGADRPVSGFPRPVSGIGRPVSGAAAHPAPVSGGARYPVSTGAPRRHATAAPPRPTYPTAGYPPPPYREPEPTRGGWAPTSGGGVGLAQSRPATDPRLRAYPSDLYDTGSGRHPHSDLLTPSGNIPRYVDPPSNRAAAVGFAFGFTPLSPLSLLLGIVGLIRSRSARKGRGLAVAAIVMSLAWAPVVYLATTHVLAQHRAKPAAHAVAAPSAPNTEPAGYDQGCAASDATSFTFNKNLQAHTNNAAKLLVDFKTAATGLNAAATLSAKPAAATAMKKLASDLTSIYTALSKGTPPNTTVMNRLDADGAAIDKACGKK